MSIPYGKIVLMGSGELTATMVDVHKELLRVPDGEKKAVFLDTPAGFQLNVDQISQRAVDYFKTHIQHPLSVASFKSKDNISPVDAESAFHLLRKADYVLIGPGSPTYAVNQWRSTPVPEILIRNIESGRTLVAASAAALTVGCFTLPVYEIYKVGGPLHWTDGMDLFRPFGFNLVVIPHWNNAEGGTHDTRCCFMGADRFDRLASLLPEDLLILGLDEHTACILDLENGKGTVRGIGRMVLRQGRSKRIFGKGDSFPLDLLRHGASGETDGFSSSRSGFGETQSDEPAPEMTGKTFWEDVHRVETGFQEGLDARDPVAVINSLLDLDRLIWKAKQDGESEETISQARDMFRECIVLSGTVLTPSSTELKNRIAPLVEELLHLRNGFRQNGLWDEADAVRACLHRAGFQVEDTKNGTQWWLTD